MEKQNTLVKTEKIKVYTGTKPCGCLIAVMGKGLSDENEELGRWKDLNYKIEEMDLEDARSKLRICKHKEE